MLVCLRAVRDASDFGVTARSVCEGLQSAYDPDIQRTCTQQVVRGVRKGADTSRLPRPITSHTLPTLRAETGKPLALPGSTSGDEILMRNKL